MVLTTSTPCLMMTSPFKWAQAYTAQVSASLRVEKVLREPLGSRTRNTLSIIGDL